MESIAVRNLSFRYPGAASDTLRGVDFRMEAGDFAVLIGATGSGKSTLLRLLKPELASLGVRGGEICVAGEAVPAPGEWENLRPGPEAQRRANRVGYVMQRPEQQIVTDKVWHELAFALENMGLPQAAIRRRVAEMASYFGIADWFERDVHSLSGGQKQLLNLAAVMVAQPEVLLLDEPTSQLDPIAAGDFLNTVKKLNLEMGITVLLIEHRLEEALPMADRVLVLENGELTLDLPPAAACEELRNHPALLHAMPGAVRLFHAAGATGTCPITVREGRRFLRENYGNEIRSLDVSPAPRPDVMPGAVRQFHAADAEGTRPITVREGRCFLRENCGNEIRSLDASPAPQQEAMPGAVRLSHASGAKENCPITVREDRRFLRENYGNEVRSLDASPAPQPEAMPGAVRLFHSAGAKGNCPITVREGRRFLRENYGNEVRSLDASPAPRPEAKALELRDVYFRYGREQADVLRGLNLDVRAGEILCLLGPNGSGKSTALKLAAGLIRAYSGDVRIFGRRIRDYKGQSLYRECVSMLPQDAQTVFLKNTVRDELREVGADPAALPYSLDHLMDRHPYDLSGGEQQLVALAKVLASKPKLLLLDEPTKGIDANTKRAVRQILRRLRDAGAAILIVTHDVEFAANCADRCALIFRGEIASADAPNRFFDENSFYTTAANRICRGWYDGVATVEDAAELCRRNGAGGAGTGETGADIAPGDSREMERQEGEVREGCAASSPRNPREAAQASAQSASRICRGWYDGVATVEDAAELCRRNGAGGVGAGIAPGDSREMERQEGEVREGCAASSQRNPREAAQASAQSASRICRARCDDIPGAEDATELCRKNGAGGIGLGVVPIDSREMMRQEAEAREGCAARSPRNPREVEQARVQAGFGEAAQASAQLASHICHARLDDVPSVEDAAELCRRNDAGGRGADIAPGDSREMERQEAEAREGCAVHSPRNPREVEQARVQAGFGRAAQASARKEFGEVARADVELRNDDAEQWANQRDVSGFADAASPAAGREQRADRCDISDRASAEPLAAGRELVTNHRDSAFKRGNSGEGYADAEPPAADRERRVEQRGVLDRADAASSTASRELLENQRDGAFHSVKDGEGRSDAASPATARGPQANQRDRAFHRGKGGEVCADAGPPAASRERRAKHRGGLFRRGRGGES